MKASYRSDKINAISPSIPKEKLGYKERKLNFCAAIAGSFQDLYRTQGIQSVIYEVANKTPFNVSLAYIPRRTADIGNSDIVGISIVNPAQIGNFFRFMKSSKIPVYRTERDSSNPLIIAGNSGILNPAPYEPFVDVFVIGNGERPIVDISNVYQDNRSMPRRRLLAKLSEIEGVYVPEFTRRTYRSGRLVKVVYKDNAQVRPAKVKDLNSVRRGSIFLVKGELPVITLDASCKNRCSFCQFSNTSGKYCQLGLGSIKGYMDEFHQMGSEGVVLQGTLISSFNRELDEIFEYSKSLFGRYPEYNASFRVDELDRITKFLRHKKTLYIAPEVGTDSLRNTTLNKAFKNQAIKSNLEKVLRETEIKTITLLSITGIPGESSENRREYCDLILWVGDQLKKQKGSGKVRVDFLPLFPMAGNKFEEYGTIGPSQLERNCDEMSELLSQKQIPSVKIDVTHIDRFNHLVQGFMDTGDISAGEIALEAFNRGWNFNSFCSVLKDRGYNLQEILEFIPRGNWDVKPWEPIQI